MCPGVAIHERVWEQGEAPRRRPMPQTDWHPRATFTLLGSMVGVFVLQWLAILAAGTLALHNFVFAIGPDWYIRPWTLITSTLAHDPTGLWHIFVNGLVLFFFGPILERIIGMKRFVAWFFASGALAGIIQVSITGGGALGASGAIMMVFGALVVLMPHEKVLIWGIVPVPFWAAGIGYALLDVLGVLTPADGIGHFAHLSGMAIGLWVGWDTRQKLVGQGYRL